MNSLFLSSTREAASLTLLCFVLLCKRSLIQSSAINVNALPLMGMFSVSLPLFLILVVHGERMSFCLSSLPPLPQKNSL